jgi:hypothetical protein
MRTVNRSSLAATLSLSTVVASIFALAPIANAQIATHDATVQNTNTSGAKYVDPAGFQYFANGATFPAGGLRALLDFYGAAVPNTVLNIGQPNTTSLVATLSLNTAPPEVATAERLSQAQHKLRLPALTSSQLFLALPRLSLPMRHLLCLAHRDQGTLSHPSLHSAML